MSNYTIAADQVKVLVFKSYRREHALRLYGFKVGLFKTPPESEPPRVQVYLARKPQAPLLRQLLAVNE
jgi:hypothetical protein